MNLGVFLVEIKEFKCAVKAEIKKKLELIKVLSVEKFTAVLEKNTDIHGDIHGKLEAEATTISEYIDQLMYMNGNVLAASINEMT